MEMLRRSEVVVESKLSSEQGRSLLALLGLDRAIAAGEGFAQFEGSASGAWGAPVRLKAKIFGAGLDAEAQGTTEPWAQEPKAGMNLRIGSANLAPLLDLNPADKLAQNVGLSARLTVAGNKWIFDDLDSSIEGSRLRGRIALTLDGAPIAVDRSRIPLERAPFLQHIDFTKASLYAELEGRDPSEPAAAVGFGDVR